MKKILIVFPYQWGYNTDYLFYSNILRESYEVTYIGYDMGLDVIPNKDINIIHIPYQGKKTKIIFLNRIYNLMKNNDYSYVFINYFIFCSVINLFSISSSAKILDIRTSYILPNKFKMRLFNFILKLELRLFKNITVISQGVKEFLKLPERAHVLPLGGPKFPTFKKRFNEMNFFYVGTFFDRNIEVTIEAFGRFFETHGHLIKMKYAIVGTGTNEEINKVLNSIKNNNLERKVSFHGSIRYPELNRFFEDNNIGVSYIPVTEYYDCQPPTKTFEYLLSGMAVLATCTKENLRVINDDNGVAVKDDVNSTYLGMVKIYQNLENYYSVEIQNSSEKYTWQNIVKNILIPFLEGISVITKNNK